MHPCIFLSPESTFAVILQCDLVANGQVVPDVDAQLGVSHGPWDAVRLDPAHRAVLGRRRVDRGGERFVCESAHTFLEVAIFRLVLVGLAVTLTSWAHPGGQR